MGSMGRRAGPSVNAASAAPRWGRARFSTNAHGHEAVPSARHVSLVGIRLRLQLQGKGRDVSEGTVGGSYGNEVKETPAPGQRAFSLVWLARAGAHVLEHTTDAAKFTLRYAHARSASRLVCNERRATEKKMLHAVLKRRRGNAAGQRSAHAQILWRLALICHKHERLTPHDEKCFCLDRLKPTKTTGRHAFLHCVWARVYEARARPVASFAYLVSVVSICGNGQRPGKLGSWRKSRATKTSCSRLLALLDGCALRGRAELCGRAGSCRPGRSSGTAPSSQPQEQQTSRHSREHPARGSVAACRHSLY